MNKPTTFNETQQQTATNHIKLTDKLKKNANRNKNNK